MLSKWADLLERRDIPVTRGRKFHGAQALINLMYLPEDVASTDPDTGNYVDLYYEKDTHELTHESSKGTAPKNPPPFP